MNLQNQQVTPLENPLFADLKWIQQSVYAPCGLHFTQLHCNESTAYCGCHFQLDEQVVEHRTAKITPTKTGQFVAIWKRNEVGITAPFDVSDVLDFLIITCKTADNMGQFIFPKAVLVENGIVSQKSKGGKRGIRVYPPWDTVTSKRAQATQDWQVAYFVHMNERTMIDFVFIRNLLKKAH